MLIAQRCPTWTLILLAAAVACTTLARPALAADPANKAEQFQANVTPYQWPPPFSALNQLLSSVDPNTSRDWPSDGGPIPPGAPPGATRIRIHNSFKSETWVSFCTQLCFEEGGSNSVSITFDDGSDYSYGYSWSKSGCFDTGDFSTSKTVTIGDCSNINNNPATGLLGHFTVRQKTDTDLAASHTSESSVDLRSPAGAAQTFSPPQNLHSIAPPPAAGAAIELRGGPGSTLDLRGYSASSPLLTTSTPVQIFADAILLDPGVTLASILSPAPDVHPGENVQDLTASLERYPKEMPPGTSLCRINVRNYGNQPETITANWSDTAGWILPGGDVVVIPPAGSHTFTFGVATPPPPVATGCDASDLSFVATSMGGGGGADGIASCDFRLYGAGDLDGDGIKNSADNAPLVANPSQADMDHDWRGDAIDNCPTIFNPLQDDADQDGIGNACENLCAADFDLSGTLAVADIFTFLNAWFAGDPRADFDTLNGLQVADVFAYLNAWFAGCP